MLEWFDWFGKSKHIYINIALFFKTNYLLIMRDQITTISLIVVKLTWMALACNSMQNLIKYLDGALILGSLFLILMTLFMLITNELPGSELRSYLCKSSSWIYMYFKGNMLCKLSHFIFGKWFIFVVVCMEHLSTWLLFFKFYRNMASWAYFGFSYS